MMFWVMWFAMIDAQLDLMCHGIQSKPTPRA